MTNDHDNIVYYRQRAQQMRDKARLFTGRRAHLYGEASEHFERMADSLMAARRTLLH